MIVVNTYAAIISIISFHYFASLIEMSLHLRCLRAAMPRRLFSLISAYCFRRFRRLPPRRAATCRASPSPLTPIFDASLIRYFDAAAVTCHAAIR